MPKPIFDDNGSGMHTHISLWKSGQPLFAGDGYAGLSKLAMHSVGGILKRLLCSYQLLLMLFAFEQVRWKLDGIGNCFGQCHFGSRHQSNSDFAIVRLVRPGSGADPHQCYQCRN